MTTKQLREPFNSMPRALMNPDYDVAKSFGALAGALVNHWGAIATGLLLCAGLPALVSVQADIEEAATAATKDKKANDQNWRRNNHLEFEPTSVLAAVIAAAAPLLAGPTVDILGVLLRGG